jgi:replicative DNA helicase
VDIERALISRTVQGGQIEHLISRGISHTHFEDPNGENAQIFKTMVKHMSTYNAPPSRDAVMAQHPGARLDIIEDSIDYLVDEFIRKVKKRETQKALIEAAERLEVREDQMDLELVLFEAAEHVAQIVPTSRVSKLSEVPNRIELLRKRMLTGVIPGVQIGWPTIDEETLGVQNHELAVFAAFSNAGKSTILQFSALAGYLTDPSTRPRLFISLEMDSNTLLRKFDAMAAKIQLHAVKKMEMGREAISDDQMRMLEQWAERASTAHNDIYILDDIAHCTVERVLAETMRYKPVATYTDYLQYMDGPGDNSYSKVGSIAKGLKRIARLTGIPQFTAAQTTRGAAKDGVKEDNIADSIEIYRSADWMFGIERNDELDAQRKAMLKIVKARDGRKGLECEIGFNFEIMDFNEAPAFSGKNMQVGWAPQQPPALPINGATPEDQAMVNRVLGNLGGEYIAGADVIDHVSPDADPGGHKVILPGNPFA